MGLFTTGVQNSLAPFDDAAGSLQTLVGAYGSMFDPVASIVTEQGSPDGQLIGQTSLPIANTGAITSISIGSALINVSAGQPIMIVAPGGTLWENFTASGSVSLGAVSVGVNSQTPRNNYPAGSYVQLGYLSGWSSILDPDVCPTAFLPYLAQYVGVVLPPNTPDAQARAILNAEAGFQRGTVAAIVAAAKRFLTGTQSVALLERTAVNGSTDPYHFLLIVRPEELLDLNGLSNAVDAVKPAGLQWRPLIQTDAFTWVQAINQWSADTFSWNASASNQP